MGKGGGLGAGGLGGGKGVGKGKKKSSWCYLRDALVKRYPSGASCFFAGDATAARWRIVLAKTC